MDENRVYRNELPVWVIDLINTSTNKKLKLEVTGRTNNEATQKCVGLLDDYHWLSTSPLYK
jgi:hypothetical protein